MPLPRLSALPPRPGAYTTVGSYSRQISLVAPGARNPDGSQQAGSPALTTWAAIRGLAGEELDKAQQIAQRVSHLVTIPYQLGVNEGDTLSFVDGSQNRVFQIHAIDDPDERHIELRLYCAEFGQNAGSAP
jgi:SPP1 family predicted phage head-tail adaptor